MSDTAARWQKFFEREDDAASVAKPVVEVKEDVQMSELAQIWLHSKDDVGCKFAKCRIVRGKDLPFGITNPLRRMDSTR